MKLALNIHPIKYPLTGIGRYTYELAKGLESCGRLEELVYLGMTGRKRALPNPCHLPVAAGLSPGGKILAMLKNSPLAPLLLGGGRWALSRRLSLYRDHVYHGPNFYLPRFDGPSVVTFHDVSVLAVPQFHPPARVRMMRGAMDKAVERARRILTISNFSRDEILREYAPHADKVRVTHLAPSGDFKPMRADETMPYLGSVGLEHGKYCLFVGTIEPRKNIDVLLDAYEGLAPGLRSRFPLVLGGYYGWESDALHQRLHKLSGQGWLKYLGFVGNDDLPALMAGASLFLFPSHYEGFGLPPLEAMCCGVPVLASDKTSLPEVIGEAGRLLEPGDADAWREAINDALENAAWREEAVLAGFARAGEFSWERCVRETIAVYSEAAGE